VLTSVQQHQELSTSKVVVKEVRLNDEVIKATSKLSSPSLKFPEMKSPEKVRDYRSPVTKTTV
jgi:hypothetical protein